MSTTARLIGDESHPSHDSWAQSTSLPHLYANRASRVQRKPIPVQDQYELVNPTVNNTEHTNDTKSPTHPHVSYLPNKRSAGWLWEALSFIVAILCFAAIIGMLLGLHEKPVPDWPSGISVNAILSVLVTVMKGGMAICVAESLSQLKWAWFRKERKLIDLSIFDEASRGILGATRLLTTFRAWYLAYVGAFVFLAAFIIGPTVQQMVEIRTRQIDLPLNASVPVCNQSYYEVIGLGAGAGLNRCNLPMIGAMYDGFLQTSSQSPLRPDCPTGNCTYPIYHSLGMCHECADHSDQLVYVNITTNETSSTSGDSECAKTPYKQGCILKWPGTGITLQSDYGMINSTVDYTAEDYLSSATPIDNTTVHTFRAITFSQWQQAHVDPRPPVATECSLHICIKTYNSSVNAGTFQENLINSTWANARLDGTDPYYSFQNNIIIPARPCYINGTEKSEPWNDKDRAACTYNITSQSAIAFVNTFSGLTEGQGSAIVSNRPSFSNDIMQAVYGLIDPSLLYSADLGAVKTIDRAFQSLAETVTNQARASVDNCGGASSPGIQSLNQLYVHVKWLWILPTVVILLLCLVFFLATIVQSWREDLWKSSPLALLFVRPYVDGKELTAPEMIRAAPGSRPHLSTIEKAAAGIEVRLERDTGHYRAEPGRPGGGTWT